MLATAPDSTANGATTYTERIAFVVDLAYHLHAYGTVSYTHLDVYKRQGPQCKQQHQH